MHFSHRCLWCQLRLQIWNDMLEAIVVRNADQQGGYYVLEATRTKSFGKVIR
jgi:hypothetical protein